MTSQSSATTELFPELTGPFGLTITASRSSSGITAPYYVAKPDYLNNEAVQLRVPRLAASGIKVTPGGVAAGIPRFALTANQAVVFDADGDNSLDSFYIDQASAKAKVPLPVLGVVLEGAILEANDLSNHPTLLQRLGKDPASGQWLGSIGVRGSKLTLPALPGLTVSAKASGAAAFSARYGLDSGDLVFDLAKVAYKSPHFALSLEDSTLSLLNSSKQLAFNGQGTVAIPALGLGELRGALDLRLKDNRVDQLSSSLAWSNDGTRELTINGLGFKPLQAELAFNVSRNSAQAAVRELHFKNGQFQLSFGDQAAQFSGNLKLDLTPQGQPLFNSGSLKLDSDVSINLGGFNVRLLANDPDAPTQFKLLHQNGALVPSLSGKIEFTDLSGLTLEVAEGGISYGANGWAFNDVSLGLGSTLELGPIRLGDNASARYQNGTLTLNPDLSINLDSFNLALRPLGQLIGDVVTPVTAPIVKVFQSDIDLRSSQVVRDGMDLAKEWLELDLEGAWGALVTYLEDVPGNPYKDNKLSVGELLDFVSYRAFDLVRSNPTTAQTLFKSTFGADLPDWLVNLPAALNYADISMSATIARLDTINQLAAQLANAQTSEAGWTSLPFEVQLGANTQQPILGGGDASLQALKAQLSQLSTQLQQLEQQNPTKPPEAIRELKSLPLSFGTSFEVPLLSDPISTLLGLIANKRVDLVRNNVTLGTGIELNLGLPLAPLVAPLIPPLAPVLEAANARFKLKAGLGAQAALTLGLSSTTSELQAVVDEIANRTASAADLAQVFAGRDPLTGQALGLYVGQSGSVPMLQLSPSVQAGIEAGRFGVSAEAYARAAGKVNVNLTSGDGSNRAYLSDVLTGLASLPGLKVDGSVTGALGVNVDPVPGGPWEFEFEILKNTTLLDLTPQPQALMLAASPLNHVDSSLEPLI